MRVLSWLRRVLNELLGLEPNEHEQQTRLAREELEQLRSLTVLAVVQARRTELELREALDEASPDHAELARLVPRLEEERARAEALVKRYRHREEEEAARLSRLGKLRLAEEVNQRRRELRDALILTADVGREEDLARMEDEARAEAASLDLLERLDAGDVIGSELARRPVNEKEEIETRAHKLLDEVTDSPDQLE